MPLNRGQIDLTAPERAAVDRRDVGCEIEYRPRQRSTGLTDIGIDDIGKGRLLAQQVEGEAPVWDR